MGNLIDGILFRQRLEKTIAIKKAVRDNIDNKTRRLIWTTLITY